MQDVSISQLPSHLSLRPSPGPGGPLPVLGPSGEVKAPPWALCAENTGAPPQAWPQGRCSPRGAGEARTPRGCFPPRGPPSTQLLRQGVTEGVARGQTDGDSAARGPEVGAGSRGGRGAGWGLLLAAPGVWARGTSHPPWGRQLLNLTAKHTAPGRKGPRRSTSPLPTELREHPASHQCPQELFLTH